MKQVNARSFMPMDGEGQPMLGLLLAIPVSVVAWLMIGGAIRLLF